mmetsp:Transcript_41265/g.99400  ORF Transcript_41265/g.99400 Transcript_41265/m.99400 type:complete len:138 (-) Transcript_41265:2090-2503(-)
MDLDLDQDRVVKVTAGVAVIPEVEAIVEATVVPAAAEVIPDPTAVTPEAEVILDPTAVILEAEVILAVEVIPDPTVQGLEVIRDRIPVDLDLTLEVIVEAAATLEAAEAGHHPSQMTLRGKKRCSLMPTLPLPSLKI